MVTEFSTASNRHNFVIDGQPYFLNKVAFGDLDIADQIANTPPEQVPALARDLISRFGDERTVAAINKLSIADAGQLFREWMGITPGESSGSDASSESAEPSSGTTSEPSAESPTPTV